MVHELDGGPEWKWGEVRKLLLCCSERGGALDGVVEVSRKMVTGS